MVINNKFILVKVFRHQAEMYVNLCRSAIFKKVENNLSEHLTRIDWPRIVESLYICLIRNKLHLTFAFLA